MAQDTSIEAARSRIQRLVEEITALARKEMRSEEFFQQYLARVVQATDARGGAVWLVAQRPGDGKSEFQLAAQVEFESALFHSDEQQHSFLLRQLAEAVQTRTTVISPAMAAAPNPGSLEAHMAELQGSGAPVSGNRTAYPFFHLPLMLKDQVLGVLQVWLQPYVTKQNYGEFVTFLTSLASHVEHHFHSRRLGNLVLENQRLQQVLKFTSDLAGSLDPLEVARLAVNYGRDMLSCERCSLLTLRGDRWKVLAISGQEVVEPKSSMVKAMAAFVGAHAQLDAFPKQEVDPRLGAQLARHGILVLSKKELLARADSVAGQIADTPLEPALPENKPSNASEVLAQRRTDEADLVYFEHSHVHSAAMAPMFNDDEELVGVFFAESTTEGYFEAPGGKDANGTQRLVEWLAVHSGKSLRAAQDYQSLPGLTVSRKMRATYYAATGRKRARFILNSSILGAIALIVAFYPKMDQVDGNCSVLPQKRAAVVPEVPGRVEKVMAREGTPLKKGDPIAQMDTKDLELKLEGARQERLRTLAEGERLRGLGDEAQAQVAFLQAGVAQKTEELLKKNIEAATLRSPIDGVVLTKDLELHSGEFIQAGQPFAEVAALDVWDLVVEVNERKIGKVIERLDEGKPLPVNYILYSQSAIKLQDELQRKDQISAMAYPRETENVFMVLLPNMQAPENLKRDLRPGLTGRAKVTLGRVPLIWWTFRNIVDWVRLKWIH